MSRRHLEKSGVPGRTEGLAHRRNADMHRRSADRLSSLEAGAGALKGAVVRDLELTTTAENFQHGLGRAYQGAFVAKGLDGSFDLIVEDPAGTTPTNAVRLSVSSGTHTVRVVIF